MLCLCSMYIPAMLGVIFLGGGGPRGLLGRDETLSNLTNTEVEFADRIQIKSHGLLIYTQRMRNEESRKRHLARKLHKRTA
jgi:hypothetical protein